MLMALEKREFYDKDIHPHEDLNTVNAIFFRDIATQNRMARNACIFKTEQEAVKYAKQKGGSKNASMTVEKHPILFCLNINQLLMMFLQLIPVAMVEQKPTSV